MVQYNDASNASTSKQGTNYVVVGLIAVAIIVSLFFLFRGGGSKAKLEAPPGQKIIYPENEPPRLQEQF